MRYRLAYPQMEPLICKEIASWMEQIMLPFCSVIILTVIGVWLAASLVALLALARAASRRLPPLEPKAECQDHVTLYYAPPRQPVTLNEVHSTPA